MLNHEHFSKEMRASVSAKGLLPPGILAYTESLARPWVIRQAKPCIQVNNVSPEKTLMASTWKYDTFSVAANTQTVFNIFPGHSVFQQEDLIAAHCYMQQCTGPTNYFVGPIQGGGPNACISACVQDGLAFGALPTSSVT